MTFDKQDIERTIAIAESKGYFKGDGWAWFYIAESLVKAIVYLADKLSTPQKDGNG